MESCKKIQIFRIKDKLSEEIDDLIAVEKRMKISVNGRNVLNLYCTPIMVRELAVGIIHNEGLISGEWCAERISIEYGEEILVDIPASGTVYDGETTLTSGCAGGLSSIKRLPEDRIHDDTSINIEVLRRIFREFQKKSEAFRLTGGVHGAALTDREKILAFAEDIGRHNAVDKVIGYFVLEKMSFEDKMLFASGRLSSEIVSKCARCSIPVLVSRAAPTSLAVEIAESTGITLIGFMRGDRMNVYAGRHRIIL